MKPETAFAVIILVSIFTVSGCTSLEEQSPTTTHSPVGMANPAAVYCEEHGGTHEVREDFSGGQYGVCILENGTVCDAWAYYRDEC